MILKFLIAFVLLAAITNGQIDKTFCDQSTIVTASPNIPFNIPLNPIFQYEMAIEVNSELSKSTYRMDQYFDGLLNQAVDVIKREGKVFTIFTYDNTNEVIVVSGDACVVQSANAANSFSPIPSIVINGTEHIISPLQLLALNNPDFKLLFIGTSTVRGIAVNQWQACNYIDSAKITQRITYSLSNPNVWSIAIPYGNFSVTPVEVKVENKLPNGTVWTDIYAISDFLPAILTTYDFWQTPSGVYCPGRNSTKPTPKPPKAFKFRAEVVAPKPGTDEIFGDIEFLREVYDYPNNLFRIDHSRRGTTLTEIHDYKTGLHYSIDRFNGNCTIKTLDPNSIDAQLNGNFVSLKNATSFFDFDNTNYQYSGQRHVNHINCDTWIGQKMMFNTTTTWEWYFMDSGFFEDAGVTYEFGEPVLLIITFYRLGFNNQTQQTFYYKEPIYYYFYEFDETGLNTFDFEIGKCYDRYPKKHYLFELPTDYYDLMEKYQTNLKLGVLIGLTSNIGVYPTRISELQIDFNVDNIVVVFTLLDKAPFYGNVQMTIPEIPLDIASQLLNITIHNSSLLIPFIVDKDTQFDLVALPRSLREIEARGAGLVYISRETIKNVGYSGGQVGGIAFGLLVLGLVIGIVAGVFFCIYKPDALPLNKISEFSPIDKITGFINPSYKGGPSSDA